MDKVDVKTEAKLDKTTGDVVEEGIYIKKAYAGNGYLFNINLGTEHLQTPPIYAGLQVYLLTSNHYYELPNSQ